MGSFFLIVMFCSAVHVNTDRFADMGIIVIRPPWLRWEFLAELPLGSFSGHKQRCWTVLSELRYKVAYNPSTFFLNWKQRTAGKAVKDALQYIKMYVAKVWTKTAKGLFKNVVEQVIRRQGKFCSNYSASKTKKYLSKNSTIGHRLLFSN